MKTIVEINKTILAATIEARGKPTEQTEKAAREEQEGPDAPLEAFQPSPGAVALAAVLYPDGADRHGIPSFLREAFEVVVGCQIAVPEATAVQSVDTLGLVALAVVIIDGKPALILPHNAGGCLLEAVHVDPDFVDDDGDGCVWVGKLRSTNEGHSRYATDEECKSFAMRLAEFACNAHASSRGTAYEGVGPVGRKVVAELVGCAISY